MSLVICFRAYRALDMRYNAVHHLRLPAAEGILCTGLRWVFYRESSFGRAGRSRVELLIAPARRPTVASVILPARRSLILASVLSVAPRFTYPGCSGRAQIHIRPFPPAQLGRRARPRDARWCPAPPSSLTAAKRRS